MTTEDVVVCVHVTVAAGREAEFLDVMRVDAVESRKVWTTECAYHRQAVRSSKVASSNAPCPRPLPPQISWSDPAPPTTMAPRSRNQPMLPTSSSTRFMSQIGIL